MTVNHDVAGSSPAGGANNLILMNEVFSFHLLPFHSSLNTKECFDVMCKSGEVRLLFSLLFPCLTYLMISLFFILFLDSQKLLISCLGSSII